MLASDETIQQLVEQYGMIEPFVAESVKVATIDGKEVKVPSYGLSSYGYDVRLAKKFKLFMGNQRELDILNYHAHCHELALCGDSVVIPPGGLLLGVTEEYFKMPPDYNAICVGKSTWARVGAHVLTTPLEAGWEGNLVVEIANLSGSPIRIYAGVGIAQIQFYQGDKPCMVSYKDRGGKYQGQQGVTSAKL